jgi:predicted transcriptional regulator
VLLAVALGACQTLPDDAFRLTESALELREIQTRSIEGISEVEILAASSGVLQDLGYTIDEVEKELGVLSASKRANAKEATEILGKIALDVADCMLTFLLGCENDSYQSSKDVQDIRMTLVVLPNLEKEGEYQVRLTMQRIVWAKSGEVYAQETINDATIYQAFFDKLSKSVFLEKEGV